MNIKLRRIGAYLIDYIFVIFLIGLISQINIINPYYDEYYEAYQEYETMTNDILPSNALETVFKSDYINTYQNVLKYGTSISIISIIVYLLYFIGFQKWNNNQTLGKKLFNLKIVNKDKSKPVSWVQYIVRTIVIYNIIFNCLSLVFVWTLHDKSFIIATMIINAFSYLITYGSLLLILFRTDNKGIHDIICKTAIVENKKSK